MQKAAALAPVDAALLVNLAGALAALARHPEAEAAARRALALAPELPEALNNLGIALKGQGKLDEAVACYERAVCKKPDFAEAHNNLGNALKAKGTAERAVECYRRALALRPGFADAWNDLGAALFDLGEKEQAVACFREALGLRPEFADALFNLAFALKEVGDFEEALACFRLAARKKPALADVNRDRSLPLLCSGRLWEGWREYEWRGAMRSLGPFVELAWKGEPLAGKTLLIWSEQGIGDQILFASCFPDALRLAGHCIIECDARLVPLFRRSFPGASVHGDKRFGGGPRVEWDDFSWLDGLPRVDHFVLAGSLPRFFRSSLAGFPADNRFLVADGAAVRAWRGRLASLGGGRKIGVSWRSIDRSGARPDEHPPLACWGPLLERQDVRFVSLQAAATEDELRGIEEAFGCRLHVFDDLDLLDDLDGAAALTAAVDGVVATQTNVAEMAGGLGRPTWRVARGEAAKDWSCLGTDRRPWYPGMRALFGLAPGELTEAFRRVAAEVAGLPPAPV
jgi:tetratricopeptide (TPR) repeat protein